MEPTDKSNYGVIMAVGKDGERIEIDQIADFEIAEIAEPETETKEKPCHFDEGEILAEFGLSDAALQFFRDQTQELDAQFEEYIRRNCPWLFYTKLSRKRFKKLLMSHGSSRNLAEEVALTYNRCRVPYSAAYKEIAAYTILKAFWPNEHKDE